MKKNFLIVLTFFMTILFSTCSNPTPSLTAISPVSKVTHMPTFTLTATGSGFFEESVIVFNGQEKETTFVSETELTCEISPEDTIVTAPVKNNLEGSSLAETTVPVLVRNPSPGGGDSESVNFTIKDNHTFVTPTEVGSSFPSAVAGNMALDPEGNLYLVIYKFNIPEVVIYYIRSSDQGNSWSSPVRLSELGVPAGSARLLADNDGNMHFIYLGNEVYPAQVFYRRKLAGESAWESKRMLSVPDSQEYTKSTPSIAAYNGHILVFWNKIQKNGEFPFMMTHSPDNGTTWSNPKVINKLGNGFNPIGFTTVSDSGIVLFVYQSMAGIKSDIYYASSTDNGQTWSDPVMLSDGTGKSHHPRVFYPGSGQSISAVWTYGDAGAIAASIDPLTGDLPQQYINPHQNKKNNQVTATGSLQLKMTSSQNLGADWSGIKTIYTFSFHKGNYILPGVGSCDSAGNFNLAWFDGPDDDKFKVYYMRSINNGTTWTNPKQVWARVDTKCTYMNVDSLGNIYLSIYEGTPPFSSSAYITKSNQ